MLNGDHRATVNRRKWSIRGRDDADVCSMIQEAATQRDQEDSTPLKIQYKAGKVKLELFCSLGHSFEALSCWLASLDAIDFSVLRSSPQLFPALPVS